MAYQGDWVEDSVHYFTFFTRKADSTPITLAGTPSLQVYKDDGTTQSTAGLTLTVDFDSVTGQHMVKVDTSADAFYAVAHDYNIQVAAGTVDGISVVGAPIGSFSIENRTQYADVTKMNGTALDSFVGPNFNHFFDNDSASTIVKVDDVLTSGGAICYPPTTATRVIGDDEGGTVADMAVVDGNVYQTGENATTGLEVTVNVDIGEGLGERLSKTDMRVRYSGAGGHEIDVAVYNHDSAAYDTILTLTTSTSLNDYSANLATLADGTGALAAGLPVYKNPATNAVDFRFKHNVVAYNAAHYLQIDYLCAQTLLVADVPTVDEISAQLDTDGFLKAATPANNEITATGGVLSADVTKWSGTTIPGVDTAGYPRVTIKDGTGAGEINLNAGEIVAVGTVLGSVDGSVLGNVAGSVGSVAGDVIGSVLGNVTGVLNPVTAGTVTDKTGYALTADYDAAKTAATQTSVNDLPTLAEMEASNFLLRSMVSGQNDVNVTAAGSVLAHVEPEVDEIVYTHIVYLESNPSTKIAGALVLATSDAAGTLLLGSGVSDLQGEVKMNLVDGATVYFWRTHTNYTFPEDPKVEVVAP